MKRENKEGCHLDGSGGGGTHLPLRGPGPIAQAEQKKVRESHAPNPNLPTSGSPEMGRKVVTVTDKRE